MSDNSYELRQILSELQKITKELKALNSGMDNVERAIYDTQPE